MKLSIEHKENLNHWRNELLSTEKTYHSKNFEKEKMIRIMLNKYLDDVIEHNKNNKKTIKNKCNAK